MTLLLSIFTSDVLPIFVVAGVGFAMARVFGADVKTLSRVTFNALSPCLVFHLLVTSPLSASDFGRMTALATIVILGIGLVARLVTLPLGLDRAMSSAFLIVVMFSNSGNYGLPVILFAFGRDALAHATVYFVANAVATYTLGVFLASAGHRSIRHAASGVLRVPAVWGVVAAGIVVALGVQLPAGRDAADRTAQRCGAADDDPGAGDAARTERVARTPRARGPGRRPGARRHPRRSPSEPATCSA